MARDFYQMTLTELLVHDNPQVQKKAQDLALELNKDQFHPSRIRSIPIVTMKDMAKPRT
jgi:hypothetical protein